jgi:hypothetical protein
MNNADFEFDFFRKCIKLFRYNPNISPEDLVWIKLRKAIKYNSDDIYIYLPKTDIDSFIDLATKEIEKLNGVWKFSVYDRHGDGFVECDRNYSGYNKLYIRAHFDWLAEEYNEYK